MSTRPVSRNSNRPTINMATSTKSKTAKKPGAKATATTTKARKTAAKSKSGGASKPVLLSGGNPQIAKGYGDEPVQSYIAAMPGWKKDLGKRIDALVTKNVPKVHKAVKWNSPFYGMEHDLWFLSFHCFNKYVKLTFFRGSS